MLVGFVVLAIGGVAFVYLRVNSDPAGDSATVVFDRINLGQPFEVRSKTTTGEGAHWELKFPQSFDRSKVVMPPAFEAFGGEFTYGNDLSLAAYDGPDPNGDAAQHCLVNFVEPASVADKTTIRVEMQCGQYGLSAR